MGVCGRQWFSCPRSQIPGTTGGLGYVVLRRVRAPCLPLVSPWDNPVGNHRGCAPARGSGDKHGTEKALRLAKLGSVIGLRCSKSHVRYRWMFGVAALTTDLPCLSGLVGSVRRFSWGSFYRLGYASITTEDIMHQPSPSGGKPVEQQRGPSHVGENVQWMSLPW